MTITSSDIGVQLEINEFEVDSRYYLGERESIEIELEVRNLGSSDASAMASVVGTQHGAEIYRETMLVSAQMGGDYQEFEFSLFRPTALGEIVWTVTIEPNIDQATATTDVQFYENESEDEDD